MSKVELGNAVLLGLSKFADKFADRDELVDGQAYKLVADVSGSINDVPFSLPVEATLTVGHESVRASSTTPKTNCVIAAILGKLNAATRAKVVQDVLDEYRETQNVTADPHMVELVDAFLAGLRQIKQESVRGAVKINPVAKDCGLVIAGGVAA